MSSNNLNTSMSDSQEAVTCPFCGVVTTSSRIEEDTFQYGEGSSAETLTAQVSVYKCNDCAEEFLDGKVDDSRHEAICNHLGVMTPRQIKALRIRYDMSRAEFARVTKLGEATLARWERGALIQTAAYDRFLYLLSHKDNMDRLRTLESPILQVVPDVNRRGESKFRCLSPTPEDRENARRNFTLTVAA